ncbi:hypothetical protein [uncultured Clostridium sp.]|uniref:hypothetical protein n=1 Tax=uncultured Clostridium sp. TaxID=59620 RepID=UPI0025973E6D|nr:hypothetical protein [uncultured Clostridium sp.]
MFKSIKLSDYFEIKKNSYEILKLTPTKSNRNIKTYQIAELVNKMYRKTNKLIYKENKKLIIEQQYKFSFYIHIEKQSIKFYAIIPKIYSDQFKVKFRETWRNIQIDIVNGLPMNINECSKYQLSYKYNDVLSLKTDLRTNELLNSNLSVTSIMEEGEMVGVFYNFIPVSDKSNNYFRSNTYPRAIQRYKNGENLKKSKNIKDLSVIALKNFISLINDLLNCILNVPQNNQLILNPLQCEISHSTKRKCEKAICKNQSIILTKSSEKSREIELSNAFSNTFKIISDDNELIINEITKNIDIKKTIINHVNVNKTTIEECSNFISMPSLEVINQFKMIEHNKCLELKAPKCLENGKIRIGTVKNKENKQEVYYSMDEQMKRLGRVLLGSMGSGKSYYMQNMASDIIKAGRGLVVIDYIDKCQLSDNIKKITSKDKLVEINFNDPKQVQSFNFNELIFNEDDDIYYKVNIAMQKAEQMQLLLDSINDDNSKLTPRMLRYFYAAATVVYYKNVNASFKEIVNVLKYPNKRAELIENIPDVLMEEIEDLKDLNKIDSKGRVENYDSKIDGILDRVSWLKTNLYTKLAFNKEADNNINFVEAMKQNKVILIKIPEQYFKSKMIRNVIATYFLNKVWISKQIDCSTHTELFFDEIHQCYNCQLLMQNILVECRKFQLTPTLALHYLDQLTPKCKNSVLASGSSYLLLQGCDVKAFKELSTYFEKDGYSEIDLAELDRYNALCLIKNEDTGYSSFIARLPS